MCFNIPPLPLGPLTWAQFSMATQRYDPSTTDEMKKMKEIKSREGMSWF